MPKHPIDTLYRRPGFMIRRAHQISQSVFTEECARLDITATQFGVLSVLPNARDWQAKA